MCDITAIEAYEAEWDDYFAFVNTDIIDALMFEDDLYIAYGSFNDLGVEDLGSWFEDAEKLYIGPDPEPFIDNKYSDSILCPDDLDYFVEKEKDEGMIYEQNGYWFYA